MLNLKFAIGRSTSCESFLLQDVTGNFSTTNPGGYGTLNEDASAVQKSRLLVYATDNTTVLYTIETYDSASDPTYTSSFETTITNAMIGVTEGNIPAQIVKMTYIIEKTTGENQFSYSKDEYVFLSCSSICCMDEMFAEAVNCSCQDKGKLQDALYLQGLITAVNTALSPSCNKIEQAYTLLDEINKICAGSGCTNCD